MFVESIKLDHYRNYNFADITLSPGVNIFFGDNAQGKTNLLESVYLCGTSRSHRGTKDKDIIQFSKEEAHIRLLFHKKEVSHRLDVHLKQRKSKGIAIDTIPLKKVSELLGVIPIVFFSPEDLSIIKNSPAVRRKFIDMEMSQLDNVYLSFLSSYNHLLKERNNLLKQIYRYPQLRETLDAWDMQLVSLGKEIIKKREAFIKNIAVMMREIHGNLTGNKEKIDVFYEKNVSEEEFKDRLFKNRELDIKKGATSVGPQRDDIAFRINDTDIRKYGSQGQQRTAALALKLSEIRLMEQMKGEKPVLLLDDVLSELDSHRQRYLLEHIADVQTMITCTGLDEFVNSRISIDKVFRVHAGTVEEYTG